MMDLEGRLPSSPQDIFNELIQGRNKKILAELL